MPFASHRTRFLFFALLLSLFGLMLLNRPAHGGWSAEPVEVHATTALCPLVSVVTDAQRGAIVVWQENTAGGGLLQARRLLANGDLDPTWTTPAAVSDRDAARGALGGVSDGAGGAYVWWMEGTQLYLTRVTSGGSVASGWVARGRNLGGLASDKHRPIAIADGSGGLYIGWQTVDPFIQPVRASARITHLGPAGAGAGGWPAGGRVFGLAVGDYPSVFSFGMDRSGDGGLWIAWQHVELMFGSALPGELRALRVTPAGVPSAGWTAAGVMLAPFDPAYIQALPGWGWYPAMAQVAVAHDDAQGAFVVANDGVADGYSVTFQTSLRHLDGSGAAFDPPAVADVGTFAYGGSAPPDSRGSLRAIADGLGGLYTGVPWYASEFTEMVDLRRRDAVGQPTSGFALVDQRGLETALRSDGGLFSATFKPSGATGPYEADAYIGVGQIPSGTGFGEQEGSYYATRYGDIGLAATDDGGAIFAWSQLIDRQGVYAIRLNPSGVVTGVPPLSVAPGFRAWFVRGAGVQVQGGSRAFSLRLHDVTGREVAQGAFDFGGEWTVPGTADLPSGIYFVNAVVGGKAAQTRIVVIR